MTVYGAPRTDVGRPVRRYHRRPFSRACLRRACSRCRRVGVGSPSITPIPNLRRRQSLASVRCGQIRHGRTPPSYVGRTSATTRLIIRLAIGFFALLVAARYGELADQQGPNAPIFAGVALIFGVFDRP